MDGQRFDAITKAMAGGATRRRALRLVGGGLAGALLAAVGVGKRAEAQEFGRAVFVNCDQNREPGDGPPFQTGPHDPLFVFSKPCPACPQDQVCVALVNPEGHLFCRCANPG